MSQIFPHYADVPLKQSPLGEVICQVRHPPIFRVATDPPSQLQDMILERFPDVQVADESERHFFRFLSTDGVSAFTLDLDAFTVSTLRYTIWDDFGRDLSLVQDAMQKTYRIPFYRRIGLRYVNLFTPENTKGESVAQIGEVLRPELTAPFRSYPLVDATELATQLLLTESEGKMIMRVGAKADPNEGGPVVFLDLDFFVEGRLSTDGLVERCKQYHDVIYDAFRWSLNEESLELFEPTKEGSRR